MRNKTKITISVPFNTPQSEIDHIRQEYKIKYNLPVLDKDREKEFIINNLNNLKEKDLEKYYLEFIKNLMDISKEYQLDLKKRSE